MEELLKRMSATLMLVDQPFNDNLTAPAPMVKCHVRLNAQPVCFVSVFQAQALNNDA